MRGVDVGDDTDARQNGGKLERDVGVTAFGWATVQRSDNLIAPSAVIIMYHVAWCRAPVARSFCAAPNSPEQSRDVDKHATA